MIGIILIPFIGTILGSLMVFFIKENKKNDNDFKFKNILYGLSSGIMLASAIFSLLIPSINYFDTSKFMKVFPTIFGLFCGFIVMILIDKVAQRILIKRNNNGLDKKNFYFRRNLLLFISLTIHNIPEGMAVGVGIIEDILNNGLILAIGIAIQNIPEGLIAALPFKNEKNLSKFAFLFGAFSGIVEPVFSIITLNIARKFLLIMPYMLSFAGGCMIYVVIKELVPSFCEKDENNVGIVSFFIGFIIMIILDVCLG